MMMSFLLFLLGLNGVCLPATNAQPLDESNEPAIMARLWVVAFNAGISGDSLPIDPRRAAMEMQASGGARAPSPDAAGRMPTLGIAMQQKQEKLDIRCRGHRILMRNGVLVSETADKAVETNNDLQAWKILAAPALMTLLKQPAMVSVGQPVPYLVRREDGCLNVESSIDVAEGLTITMTASSLEPKGIRFTDIAIKMSRVVGREPIPDVPFEVGRPRLDTRETMLNVTVDNGNVAIIPLPQAEGEPAILVFLTAEKVNRN